MLLYNEYLDFNVFFSLISPVFDKFFKSKYISEQKLTIPVVGHRSSFRAAEAQFEPELTSCQNS